MPALPTEPMALHDLLAWLRAVAEVLTRDPLLTIVVTSDIVGVVAAVAIVRHLRRTGRHGCPHCGRVLCDRRCIERGED